MNRLSFLFILLTLSLLAPSLFSQSPRKREFRAAWIASVANLDWPKPESRGNSEAQKADLIVLLDNLQRSGINAVLLQIRPECDALYASPSEPWSYWLTGAQGQPPDPYYDPLEFAIAEAHRRGMEFHAWFNPFRAARSTGSYPLASTHVSVKHPEWILTFGRINLKMLDPGRADVREYVARVVADVVRRYDVDGVHFDDYFYPYPAKTMTPPFPGIVNEDRKTFSSESRGSGDLADWRRENVNILVRMVRDSIRAVKPLVKFGISPFGIWKNGVPSAVSGLGAYEEIYCDAMAWLREGTVDYLAPQFYWQVGGEQDYATLLGWWSDSARVYGRHLYSGMAAYKIAGAGWTAEELPRQMQINRTTRGVQGEVFFRATAGVSDNPRGFTDSLRANYYRYRALLPAMGWKDSIPPLPPRGIHVARLSRNGHEIQWDPPPRSPGDEPVGSYAVYRFDHRPQPEEFSDPRNLFVVVRDTHMVVPSNGGTTLPQYYVARSLDRSQNESETGSLLVLAEPFPPTLVSPADGVREAGELVSFSWRPALLAARYRVQVATGPAFDRGYLIERSAVRETTLTLSLPTLIRRWNPPPAPSGGELLLERDSSIMERPVGSSPSGGTGPGIPQAASGARFYWRVRAENAVGASTWSPSSLLMRPQVLEVGDPAESPGASGFSCRTNDPSGRSILLAFQLPEPEWVRIQVSDLLRREERTVLDRFMPAGRFSLEWDAGGARGGYYTCRMIAGCAVSSGTVMLGAKEQ